MHVQTADVAMREVDSRVHLRADSGLSSLALQVAIMMGVGLVALHLCSPGYAKEGHAAGRQRTLVNTLTLLLSPLLTLPPTLLYPPLAAPSTKGASAVHPRAGQADQCRQLRPASAPVADPHMLCDHHRVVRADGGTSSADLDSLLTHCRARCVAVQPLAHHPVSPDLPTHACDASAHHG